MGQHFEDCSYPELVCLRLIIFWRRRLRLVGFGCANLGDPSLLHKLVEEPSLVKVRGCTRKKKKNIKNYSNKW